NPDDVSVLPDDLTLPTTDIWSVQVVPGPDVRRRPPYIHPEEEKNVDAEDNKVEEETTNTTTKINESSVKTLSKSCHKLLVQAVAGVIATVVGGIVMWAIFKSPPTPAPPTPAPIATTTTSTATAAVDIITTATSTVAVNTASSTTTTTTTTTPPQTCFANRDELLSAIDRYVTEKCHSISSCDVGKEYGWPMNS
ncbi:hypothetical protein ACHAXH_000013, partial [Discostella pseudostelligera]